MCHSPGVAIDIESIADSIERLIRIARTVDFDILDGRREAIAMLVVEGRLLASLSDEFDAVDDSAALLSELRRRRKLP
jgi:hypothetical protein